MGSCRNEDSVTAEVDTQLRHTAISGKYKLLLTHSDTVITMTTSATIAPSEMESNSPSRRANKEQQGIHVPSHAVEPPSSLSGLLISDKSSTFAAFKLNQAVSHVVLPFVCLQTIFIVSGANSVSVEGVPLALKVVAYARLLVPPIECAYLYFARRHIPSDALTAAGKRVILLGNMIILFQVLSLGALLLAWTLTRDTCHSDVCLDDYPKQLFPMKIFINIIIVTAGMPVIFPCHDVTVSFLSSFIAGLVMLASAVLLHMELVNILETIIVGITVFTIVFCFEGMFFSASASYSKFETALRANMTSENKEYLMKIQTEEMRHMIGNVAHDLRTPLQAFQSEMEILRNKIKHRLNDQTCLLSSMEQLDRICNFMNMTINRSIDFTKASSGIKLNPSIELINFSETMNWAVGCMVQSHAKVPIVFLPIPRSICNQIYTDKQWLMENMLCLLSNAQKFTTEGAITIRCSLDGSLHGAVVPQSTAFEPNSVGQITDDIPDVETGLSRTPSVAAPRQSQYVDSPGDNITEVEEISLMLLIEVEDTGIGITKENEGRLFKPFMQAQRRTGGTGLGLYALAKRMESLGGKCGFKDRADGASGCCFWISIPFKPDETVGAAMHNTASSESSLRIVSRKNSAPSIVSLMEGFIKQESGAEMGPSRPAALDDEIPSLRILLVDDSNLIQKTTSRALIKEGHQVEVAQHGAECLKMLEATQLAPCVYSFDLILMDIQMPVMDGLEATRRIREMEKSASGNDRSPHMMIIGVTANTEGEARADCMESGMDGFMEKPLKMKHFHEYITSTTLREHGAAGGRRM